MLSCRNGSDIMMTWIGWGCFAVLCFGLLMWRANQMIYYPMKYPAGEWSVQEPLGAKDVSLRAADGTKLHAWWIRAAAPGLATLHLHGNGGNITHRGLSARSIVAAGSSVLLLDYRGYGKSDGKPSEKGLHQDAEAAYDWIAAQGYLPERIIIHGESLGTAVATHLATKKRAAGLILEAPFTSAKAVAGRVMPVLGPLLVHGYDSMRRIKEIQAPVLIIHGDRDEVIAYEFGEELFRAANEPKSFWTVPGATHNDLHVRGNAEFSARLADFYRSLHSR
jgi:fermentation-respiration switch protein FrsA (DUF1100 family)